MRADWVCDERRTSKLKVQDRRKDQEGIDVLYQYRSRLGRKGRFLLWLRRSHFAFIVVTVEHGHERLQVIVAERARGLALPITGAFGTAASDEPTAQVYDGVACQPNHVTDEQRSSERNRHQEQHDEAAVKVEHVRVAFEARNLWNESVVLDGKHVAADGTRGLHASLWECRSSISILFVAPTDWR